MTIRFHGTGWPPGSGRFGGAERSPGPGPSRKRPPEKRWSRDCLRNVGCEAQCRPVGGIPLTTFGQRSTRDPEGTGPSTRKRNAGGADRSPWPGPPWKLHRCTAAPWTCRRRLHQVRPGSRLRRRPGRPGPPATTLRGVAGKSDCQIDIPGWESEAPTPPPAALTSPGPSTRASTRKRPLHPRQRSAAWASGLGGFVAGPDRRGLVATRGRNVGGSATLEAARSTSPAAERPPSSSGRRPGGGPAPGRGHAGGVGSCTRGNSHVRRLHPRQRSEAKASRRPGRPATSPAAITLR